MVLRLVLAVVGAYIAARLALHEYQHDDFAMADHWVTRHVIVLAVAAIASPVADLLTRWQQPVPAKHQPLVDQALQGALVEIVDTCSADYKRIGVNAFLVRRTVLHPLSGVQKRIARLRMSASPPPSAITWTKGKGVIGSCWLRKTEVAVNLRKQYKPLHGCTEEEWLAAPADVKQGLTYKEFQQVRGYGIIVASPMIDVKGRYRGCVSVDSPEAYDGLIFDDDVREVLQVAARTVLGVV